MDSRIARELKLRFSPIAVVFTDDKPAGALQFAPGRHGCVMSMHAAAAAGRTAVFDRQTSARQRSGQPVRHVFETFFRVRTQAPAPRDLRPAYRETHEDRLWYWLYLPVAQGVNWVTGLVTVLQRGRISTYLMYSFATLLLLLLFVR